MQKGRAPYWHDGSKIELHHTIQIETGNGELAKYNDERMFLNE
ncbi:hypothetical protein HCB52_07155 [Listeria booriae]|nr:hypothetical protein [Listeria booriae]